MNYKGDNCPEVRALLRVDIVGLECSQYFLESIWWDKTYGLFSYVN